MVLSSTFFRRPLCNLLAAVCALAASLVAHAGLAEPDRPTAEAGVKELFRIEFRAAKGSIDHDISFFTISPDSKTLVCCEVQCFEEGKPGRCELVLIDLTTGEELHRQRVESANSGLFSPDGNLLAITTLGSATVATVWDVARWEPKVQLKRPADHVFGRPLAISPDGKVVAGQVQRKKADESFTHDLVLWDVETGACRVVVDDGAMRYGLRRQREASRVVLMGKDGRVEENPRSGPPIVGHAPTAVTFPDPPGSDRLFVEYGDFVTLWDTAKGKALSTDIPLGPVTLGLGDTAITIWRRRPQTDRLFPESRADLFRFHTVPSGQIVELPKYHPPAVIAYADDQGAVVVAATPVEKAFGLYTPSPGFPFPELWRAEDYKDTPGGPTCRLSPDGLRLVALGGGVLRVWDLSALHPLAEKKVQKLAGAEREKLWASLFKDLGDPENDSPIHYTLQFQAMFSLALHRDDSVPWLREKMGPPPVDMKKVPGLIEELNSDDFDARERASNELERRGAPARPLLEKALAKDPPPEAKRRIEELLKKFRETADSYELRQMRIIDVLEHIHTAGARELLQQIADGKYDPTFAEEAKAALRRAGDKP